MRDDELEPMSASMRELLSAERPLDAVPADARARVLARATATLAGVAVAGAATSAAAAAAGAAKGGVAAKAALTTKLVIAAVAFSVGGGVGAGALAVVRPRVPAPAPAPIVIRVVTPAPAPPAPVVEEPAPTPKPEPAAKPALRKADMLDAERSLVEQARAAFARNDPAGALVTLNQHEREYPSGQLAEERMALQIIALADSGADAKAKELAKKFRARFPQSLLMPAVESRVPAPP